MPNTLTSQTELIEYWGYPVEEHHVTTEDGYILTMHRIPGSDKAPARAGPKTPVFMGHCLVATSTVYAFGPPEKSLAYILADEGALVFFVVVGMIVQFCFAERNY